MNHPEIVRTFFDAYTAHDVEAMLKLCASTAMLRYVPLGENGIGLAREMASLWQLYMDAFPDFKTEVVSLMEAANGAIVCETLNRGTQAKEIGNIQNKGKSIAASHLFIFEFNPNSLIEKITAFWDNDTIYAQLGHTENYN